MCDECGNTIYTLCQCDMEKCIADMGIKIRDKDKYKQFVEDACQRFMKDGIFGWNDQIEESIQIVLDDMSPEEKEEMGIEGAE